MRTKKSSRRFVFGLVMFILIVAFLILLDVHGFANHANERWPF